MPIICMEEGCNVGCYLTPELDLFWSIQPLIEDAYRKHILNNISSVIIFQTAMGPLKISS